MGIIRFSGKAYVNSDTATVDTARRFETETTRLRDVLIMVTKADTYFGDADNQTYRIEKDTGFGVTLIDVSTLYFKNKDAGSNSTVDILAVEE